MSQHRETAETVAIKIIDKEKLRGKENMMINEIEIMKKIDCEHCVKLVCTLLKLPLCLQYNICT